MVVGSISCAKLAGQVDDNFLAESEPVLGSPAFGLVEALTFVCHSYTDCPSRRDLLFLLFMVELVLSFFSLTAQQIFVCSSATVARP